MLPQTVETVGFRTTIYMIKVQAKLKLDNDSKDVVRLDVPDEYCNRESFIDYIKKALFDLYDVEYEVVE